MQLIDADNLIALSWHSDWPANEESHTSLCVDLGSCADLPQTEQQRLAAWFAALNLPVLGFAEPDVSAETPVSAEADAVFDSMRELERAAQNIDQNPRAALVLTQTLRIGLQLTPVAGLALESLAYGALQGSREHRAWLEQHRDEPAALQAASEDLVLVERDGTDLNVTLNSPDTQNAMSAAMRDALFDAFAVASADASIERVYVTGNGSMFSSGGELAEFGLAGDVSDAHWIRSQRLPARLVAAEPHRYHFRVHRACIGAGIELPAFAGRLTATQNTFFQLPELSMGLIPGAGGCISIPRRIGRQRTAWLAFSGKRIKAEQALEWGLIDAIEG